MTRRYIDTFLYILVIGLWTRWNVAQFLGRSQHCFLRSQILFHIAQLALCRPSWPHWLSKIRITWKKASNKSCSELNFVQKSPWAHMSISHRSRAWELERLIWLKYYIVLKRQITFNLRLNTAKNTHHLKKSFK